MYGQLCEELKSPSPKSSLHSIARSRCGSCPAILKSLVTFKSIDKFKVLPE